MPSLLHIAVQAVFCLKILCFAFWFGQCIALCITVDWFAGQERLVPEVIIETGWEFGKTGGEIGH